MEEENLEQLFGQWTRKEFEAIQGKIDEERTIDPELWEKNPSESVQKHTPS